MKVFTIDPVVCAVSREDGLRIAEILRYKKVFYKKSPFGMDRREYWKDCIPYKGKEYWYFYRGHLERIKDHVENVEYNGDSLWIKPREPSLPGITFRPDQLFLMKNAVEDKYQIGLILSPTGSGKTILQLGIISMFPDHRFLLLAHTAGIVSQTVEEARRFGIETQQIGGGVQFTGSFSGRLVVSTIQSFAKIDPNMYYTVFDGVIVDEAHRVSTFSGMYFEVLSHLMASIRLGFTATEPTDSEEAIMALEGLLGPIVGELTINEAAKLGILAKPVIKLIKAPLSQSVKKLRKYQDVYQKGVVDNPERNRLIANVIGGIVKNKTCLIFVNKIEHGEILSRLLLNAPFVQGDMSYDKREKIKQDLIDKKIPVVVATTAWREGINIPTLDIIFNAGGGKTEIPVLQSLGRGLRRAEGKEEVLIYDVFDPSHHYLISHFGERLSLYFEQGWL